MMSVGVSIPMKSRWSDCRRASSTRATVISQIPGCPFCGEDERRQRLQLVAGDARRDLCLGDE